jgi:hypothetical protein
MLTPEHAKEFHVHSDVLDITTDTPLASARAYLLTWQTGGAREVLETNWQSRASRAMMDPVSLRKAGDADLNCELCRMPVLNPDLPHYEETAVNLCELRLEVRPHHRHQCHRFHD